MAHTCTPAPFGTMDVAWRKGGLTGTILTNCNICGEYRVWEVE